MFRVSLVTGSLKESRSGKDVLGIPGAIVTGNVIRIPPNKEITFEKRFKDDEDTFRIAGRRLQTAPDERKVLVVRISVNGTFSSSPNNTASEISDSIFGTSGDDVNLVSQMSNCSFGKLQFSPLTVAEEPALPAANDDDVGVYEITTDYPSSTTGRKDLVIRDAVTDLLRAQLTILDVPGCSWCTLADSTKFDHVMYCMPPGKPRKNVVLFYVNRFTLSIYHFPRVADIEFPSIAYAFANSWMSVYNDKVCL